MKKRNILNKIVLESILISTILVTANSSNNKAEDVRKEMSTKEVTEYARIYNEVEEGSKLEIGEDGSLNIIPYTFIHKSAPEGFEIDYVNDVAYKTRNVTEYNETAEKIYKYTIIRNDLLSLAGILFSTMCVSEGEEEIDKIKKKLLK